MKIVILFVMLLIVSLIYEYMIPGTYYTLPMKVTIVNESKKIGVATGEELNFGNLPLKASSRKRIDVNNTSNLPIEITLEINGNISKIAYVNPSWFILGPKEGKNVEVGVSTNGSYSYGTYIGNLSITGDYSVRSLLLQLVRR